MKRNVLILACLLAFSYVGQGQKKHTAGTNNQGLTVPGSAFLFPAKTAADEGLDYQQKGAPLPPFEVVDYENKNITADLRSGAGNLFVIMFNPTCDHCEDQTRMLMKNNILFQKSRILMVAAPVQTPNISYFEANVHFSNYPATFTVAVDSARVIDKLFTYKSLPQINIYSKDLRLLKTYEGLVPMDSLKAYIE